MSNEIGEVLISIDILTESEGESALQPTATGLMRWYQQAEVDPPTLLHTDKDCCSRSGVSRYQVHITSNRTGHTHTHIWVWLKLCRSHACLVLNIYLSRKDHQNLMVS